MLTLEELTAFGIRPEDEGPHPFSPEYEWWNESVFYDWYTADGTNAGHCRIGWHPSQARLWFWLFLYNGAEWVAVEEPRLPLERLRQPDIAYDDGWGLAFAYAAGEPLRSGRLEASAFGRVVSGPRTGMVLPVAVALEVEAIGAAHSLGQSDVAGHSAERMSASRFEQPILVRGSYTIDGDERTIEGRGERDHSWGPRMWNMEWTFLVFNAERLRLQCADVRIPGLDPIRVGYLHRRRTVDLSSVELALAFSDERVTSPVSGTFAIEAEDGDRVEGHIESITGHEIDLSHVMVPPRRTFYRRALVRCHLAEGGPVVGWLESNRFP